MRLSDDSTCGVLSCYKRAFVDKKNASLSHLCRESATYFRELLSACGFFSCYISSHQSAALR